MLNPIPAVASPIVGSFSGALVETYLKPHLQQIKRDNNKQKALDELVFFGGFEKYLDRVYERHSEMTTLALQGKPRLLTEIYIPLRLVKTGPSLNGGEEIIIDSYPDALLPQLKRILLTDDAGMGKSTLVKFLFLQCIEAKAGLPILIELRRLREGKGISDVIVDELCEVCPKITQESMKDAVQELLNAGEFVFLLDGYDEVPFDERERVALHLREFVGNIGSKGRNEFLVSSRPDSGVSSLPGFHSFHIRPLQVKEAFDLLKKYDGGGELSKQLIAELQEQLSSIEEFLTNPMLVSLLFEAYDYTHSIPLKKAAFYRQVYDAIFERHDATKPLFKREKYSKLDRDDFERVLRALGIRTLKNGVGYSKDELLRNITDAKKMCPGLIFQESDFLQDLLSTVPLFACEGDYHRWKHKSLQEYFAARYICGDIGKEEQAEVLREMVKSGNYRNVLSLCYDLDYTTFRNSVVLDLINDFVKFYDSSYSGFESLGIKKHLIHKRKIACYSRQPVIFLDQKISDGISLIDIEYIGDRDEDSSDLISIDTINNLGIDPNFNIVWDFFGNYLCVASPQLRLVHLLDSKNSSIVLSRSTFEPERKSLSPDDYTKIHRELKRELNEESGFLLVNDDDRSPLNSVEFFRKTTSSVILGGVVLDIQACRRMKKEIEADLGRGGLNSTLGLL